MYDTIRAQGDIPLDRLGQRHTLFLSRRLFIKDISVPALGILGLGPGKDVEPLLLVCRAEQGWVPGALVLKKRIGRSGHGERCQALFGGGALVEGKVEPSCGFRHAEHSGDAICHGVDDCGDLARTD